MVLILMALILMLFLTSTMGVIGFILGMLILTFSVLVKEDKHNKDSL